jgi:hypothetical protein
MSYLDVNKINSNIRLSKREADLDSNLISDGFHTFGELYEQRSVLWIAFCRRLEALGESVWRSRKDGEKKYIEDGWFLLGIGKHLGEQMTFHLPEKYWEECAFAETLRFGAPKFDGHTWKDVLSRIQDYR